MSTPLPISTCQWEMRRCAVSHRVLFGVISSLLLASVLIGCAGPPRGLGRELRSTPATTTALPTTTPTTAAVETSGFFAVSASFVTADDGFVLGGVAGPSASCPTTECLAIRHTTDRGLTWSSLPAPEIDINAAQAENIGGTPEVHFADALNGWIYWYALWSTHDGGQHWHTVELHGTVMGLTTGEGVADALLDPCGTVPCDQPDLLFRTPADADVWSRVSDIPALGEAGSASLVDEGRTVFVLTESFNQTGIQPQVQLVASSDGLHFQPLVPPCPQTIGAGDPGLGPDPIADDELAASDPSNLVVACFGSPGAGSGPVQLYVSQDGGHSYSAFGPPSGVATGSLMVAMPTPTSALVSGASGASFIDLLSGGAWTSHEFPGSGGTPFADLAFVDPRHGAVVYGPVGFPGPIVHPSWDDWPSGPGGLFLTDDGGESWFQVTIAP